MSYTVSVLALREKNMKQNEKALILALISLLSLNRLCPKSALKHIIKGQSSPRSHYLLFFCGKYCSGLPNAREPHYFLLFLQENIAPDHCPGPQYVYLVETVPDPTIFYFSRSRILLRTAPDLVRGIVTLL